MLFSRLLCVAGAFSRNNYALGHDNSAEIQEWPGTVITFLDRVLGRSKSENDRQKCSNSQENETEYKQTAQENEPSESLRSLSARRIVGTETISVDYLTKDGSTYEITVNLADVTNIPKDAELAIRELTGDEYNQYLTDAAAELGVDVDSIAKAKLFDIKIRNGEEEIQPNGKVKVDIKLKKTTFENATVVHFGSETEVLNATTKNNVVSFETTGFSIYAVIESGEDQTIRATYIFQNADGSPYTFIDSVGNTVDNQIIKKAL